MSKAWMPLYIGDFLADTMHLNCQETGGYLRLLMHAWEHNGLIPDDDALMTRIVRCHPPHWPRLRKALQPFFSLTKTPGSWYSKRIGLELIKADEISNKRKAAALQKHSKSSANAEHLHTQSQSQSHKESVLADTLLSGTPLPQSFEPNSDNLMLADALELNPQTEIAKFKEIFVNQKPRRNWNARFSQFLREQADKYRKDNGHDKRTLTEKGRDLCAEFRLRDMDEFGSPPRRNLLDRPVPKFSKR